MDIFSAGPRLVALLLLWYNFGIFEVGKITIFIFLKVAVTVVVVIAGIRFPVRRKTCSQIFLAFLLVKDYEPVS